MYIGCSSNCAGSILLILHLQTGHIGQQFHLYFDDEFTTLPYLTSEEAPPKWSALVENNSERIDYNGNISQEWLHMPDMAMLQTPQSLANQIIIPKGFQQMIPLGTATQITPSERVQKW